MERLHRAPARSCGSVNRPYIRYDNVAVALKVRGYRIERIADLGHYSVRAFQRARVMLGEEFQRMAEAPPFPPTPYQLGLRDRFDRGLAAIITSGEYREIERRYALY